MKRPLVFCLPHWLRCGWLWSVSWVALFGLCGTPSLPAQQTALVTELTEQGLEFASDVMVKLPPPTLQPGLTEKARQAALQQLAGKQDWGRFARNSVMAPIAIDIESVEDSHGEKLGLVVHNAFIVHAELDRLRDQEAMQEIFGSPGDSAPGDSAPGDTEQSMGVVTQELTKDELQRLGFTTQARSPDTYAYLQLPLLNKVLVRGVIRLEKHERPGAVEFFWRLDTSFNTLDKYASRWTKLERNAVGKLLEGASFPYSGCGGFLGVYEIGPGSQPLLVESRLLLREPQEWFAGSHFLRSKLPSLLQENARSFRRNLTRNKNDPADR